MLAVRQLVRMTVARGSLATRQMSVSSVNLSSRKFTEKHEWITVKGDVGTVGLSKHATDLLGEIVFVELPEVGAKLAQEDESGAVESVKAASDVYSPVCGTVTEINPLLDASPALINKQPYEDGWLYRVSLSEPSQVSALMDEKSYEQYVQGLEDDH